MKGREKFIGNSAFLMMDWVLVTILSLFFWFIIGKFFPQEVYGMVATSINIIVILSGVVSLGLGMAAIKFITEFKVRGDTEKIRSMVRLMVKVILSMGIIVSISLGLLSPWISPIVNLPVGALIMVSVGVFVFSLWGITTSVLNSFQNMKYLMRTNTVGNVVKVLAALFFSFLGLSFYGPLAGLIVGVFVIVLLRFDTLLLARKPNKASKSGNLNYRSIFRYSLSAMIASLAIMGFVNTPNIILNALTSPAVTSIFAIALTITSPIITIPFVLNSALFPIISGLSARRGGKQKQRKLITMVLKYTSLVTVPILVMLLVFSDTIIYLFSSSEFLPAKSLLPLLGMAAFLFGIGNILNYSIYAVRKPSASRNITMIALAVFLALSFPLTIRMSADGMAIAYFISVSIFALLGFLYLRKSIGLSIEWMSFLKIFTAGVILFGILFAMDSTISNPILKFTAAASALVFYLIVLVPLRFYQKKDLFVLEFLSKKSPIGKMLILKLRKFFSKHI